MAGKGIWSNSRSDLIVRGEREYEGIVKTEDCMRRNVKQREQKDWLLIVKCEIERPYECDKREANIEGMVTLINECIMGRERRKILTAKGNSQNERTKAK